MKNYEPLPETVPPAAPHGYVFYSNFGRRPMKPNAVDFTRESVIARVAESLKVPESDVWVERFEPARFGDLIRWASYVRRAHVGRVNAQREYIVNFLKACEEHRQ